MMVPRFQYITDIIRGQTTVVDFGETHQFTIGEIVSFRVSLPYGMVNINNQSGKVIAFTMMSITVDIDSLSYDPFTTPSDVEGTTPPVCVPSASGIIPGLYTPTVTLFDAFDNERLI